MQNIAYQNKDIAQKYSAELLKDKKSGCLRSSAHPYQGTSPHKPSGY